MTIKHERHTDVLCFLPVRGSVVIKYKGYVICSVKEPVDLSKPKTDFRQFFINRKRVNNSNFDNSPEECAKGNKNIFNFNIIKFSIFIFLLILKYSSQHLKWIKIVIQETM